MSNRIARYIRQHHLALLALFFALTGGAAWATHPGGADTISTGDIIDTHVRTADIGSGAVQNGDIAGDAVTSGKITAGGVKSEDVLDDSLTGTDIDESTLTAGGDATGTLDSLSIANNVLGSAENLAAAEDEITDASVDSQDIANTTREIVIGAGEIGAAALTAASTPTAGSVGSTPALSFQDAVDDTLRLTLRLPPDFAGANATPVILWSAAATGGVVWEVRALYLSPGASGEEVTDPFATLTGGFEVTGGKENVVQTAIPGPVGTGAAAGDLMVLEIARLGNHVQDTLTADAALHAVAIRFTAER